MLRILPCHEGGIIGEKVPAIEYSMNGFLKFVFKLYMESVDKSPAKHINIFEVQFFLRSKVNFFIIVKQRN